MQTQSAVAPVALNVNSIEVIYDHVILVLKGVSLQVPQGAIVALLGGNGAGKTTTLRAISNLLQGERGAVTKGSITLRGERMWQYADKFISIALPRVRDFRGVSNTSFDGRGNYAMGVKEQLIYPEISYDKVEKIRGMDIIFVTSAKTDEEAHALLELLGMPFQRQQ